MKQAARLAIEEGALWQLPPGLELSLLLTDDQGIRALNSSYRALDRPTDVLSFPLWEQQPLWPPAQSEIPLPLGDIVISLETAAAQALEFGHSQEREVVFLFVHGLLHLLGYDHELGPEEEEKMFGLQKRIMQALKL